MVGIASDLRFVQLVLAGLRGRRALRAVVTGRGEAEREEHSQRERERDRHTEGHAVSVR